MGNGGRISGVSIGGKGVQVIVRNFRTSLKRDGPEVIDDNVGGGDSNRRVLLVGSDHHGDHVLG